MSIFRGSIRAIVLLCVLVGTTTSARAADTLAPYKSPDLKSPIFGGSITFIRDQRKAAATALAGIARNALDLSSTAGTRDAARLLGIALRLDPDNRAARVFNGYLSDGQHPAAQADFNKDDAIAVLRAAAQSAKSANTKPDNQAAAYLYASLLLLRADDDDRFELETLKTAGATVNWDWADQTATAAESETPAPSVKPGAAHPKRTILKTADKQAIQESLRDQTTVRGLVVITTADGQQHGKVMEIIAVAPKGEPMVFPKIKEASAVGKEMRISLEEAVRLAKLRDPRVAGMDLQISFDDKYSSKDGGSAGTAFTLLILSALNQFDLDPAAAITGDITVDGKVRPIGGLAAKLRGAALDHIRLVGMPTSNLDQLRESVLLEGPSLLWETQAIGAGTLDDAIAITRKDRTPQMEEGLKLFEDLRTKMSQKPVKELATNTDAKASLDRVLELIPNHLSALVLKELAAGKEVKKLSMTGSLEQLVIAMTPIRPSLQRQGYGVDSSAVQATRDKLEKVRPILDPSVDGIVWAIQGYCEAEDDLLTARKDELNFDRQKQSAARWDEKVRALKDAFQKVTDDNAVVDKLLRGE